MPVALIASGEGRCAMPPIVALASQMTEPERTNGNLKASTQYGDWIGVASADGSDTKTLSEPLLERGLSNEDEFFVGAKFWVGENHKKQACRCLCRGIPVRWLGVR
jgi:hypothetical protein